MIVELFLKFSSIKHHITWPSIRTVIWLSDKLTDHGSAKQSIETPIIEWRLYSILGSKVLYHTERRSKLPKDTIFYLFWPKQYLDEIYIIPCRHESCIMIWYMASLQQQHLTYSRRLYCRWFFDFEVLFSTMHVSTVLTIGDDTLFVVIFLFYPEGLFSSYLLYCRLQAVAIYSVVLHRNSTVATTTTVQ